MCNIDKAISEAKLSSTQAGIDWTLISGTYHVHGENASEVTGIDIPSGSGPVELKPGTHVRATGRGVGSITGLRVGGKPRREDQE
ncbi:MAG: hypothetical protein A2Z47_04265 [Thermodesulfovibrio sp. RBG_19FT_COMBO_42_12]|nr:MAG: hypothetical protein A2Z47_04265 [Thermodesulfovibrio sp. RBG_19FT_COMBO_42_12]